MATNSSAIQKKIETLKKGLNNKFITASQKEKIKSQVEKLESQAKASAPKKASKPAATSLTRLQKMVNNKKYGIYKGAGVDLKKDSDRPAKAIGKRTSKSGKTYYEYRANRIDVKQPPKRYPKLEKGGEMADGGGNQDLFKVDSVLWKNIENNRYNVSALIIKYDKDTELRLLVIENGILLSNWINTKYFEKQPFSEGMYPRKKFNKQKIREEVINLLKENNLDSIKKEGLNSSSLKYLKKYAVGGYMADGGETKVDRERMYNFLKDDLAGLEKAIEANNQEEIDKFFSYWSYHLSSLEPKTGSKRMYEFLKDDLVGLEAATKELPSSKEETDRFFSYWNIHLSSLEPKMEKGGYMADGGVTAKEVVESNADMVLSQIKAVKHHAEELSNVVSRKSNIEAWVVGKIERASTDLSDITHYLEGNKDKMSMGGTVRHYAHKMDKK